MVKGEFQQTSFRMVSIIIPAYNRAVVIKRTLNSILNQTYSNWQCIVVDDQSIDNTSDIVKEFVSKDSRFSLITNSRKKGAQGARNEGILQAKGDWVLLFDSDDYLFPSYLEKMVSRITKDDSIIVCYGQMVDESSGRFLEKMDKFQEGIIHTALLKGTAYVTFQASLISRKSLIGIGLLDEDCPSHQELETHLRLSEENTYCVVPEVLWHYYVGRTDAISSNKVKHIRGLLYIVKKHYWDYRFHAYKSFLVRMKRLWQYSETIPDEKIALRRLILCLAPELPILFLRNKLRWNHN